MSKALIVDDKPENLYFLAAMLSGNGYVVEKASNGLEALASARANAPDLIISDILMPGMDGFALCRHWKQDPNLQGIPFVFYTATYTEPKDEQLALSLGADLFLVKPQEPEDFMQQIAQVLRQHEAGRLLQSPAAAMEESSYLREYNAALVHKLEDKLVQLERAVKVKDVLLGSISHELRTPLTPVMLLVAVLSRDPLTPSHMREYLETIGHHIEIEKHLIGDLLDYAAMHAGPLTLYKQPLSLHGLVERAVALWREPIQAESLSMELRLEAACDQVMGDQRRLEQVLWNLMYHAIRRSPNRGSILVRSWNPRPDRIALEVRDTGKRMDAETIAWAFSPFEQGVRLGEKGSQDLGLGLAVSKGIIEAHGGDISIESKEESPSTAVTMHLPVSRA
jgi:signal transduction histidine kinase